MVNKDVYIFPEGRKLQSSKSCLWRWRKSQGKASIVVQGPRPSPPWECAGMGVWGLCPRN